MTSFHIDTVSEKYRSKIRKQWDSFTTFLEENRQHIFYLFVFYVLTIALFVERFIRKSSLGQFDSLNLIFILILIGCWERALLSRYLGTVGYDLSSVRLTAQASISIN